MENIWDRRERNKLVSVHPVCGFLPFSSDFFVFLLRMHQRCCRSRPRRVYGVSLCLSSFLPSHTPLLAGAGMTLATLLACLPLPCPDASAETLQQLLSEHGSPCSSSSPSGVGRDARGESLTPLYSPASSLQRMRSLGPVLRRRRGNLRRRRGQPTMGAGADGDPDVRTFSRKIVWRGFTAPRDKQLDALEQVLRVLLWSLC